MCVVYFIVFARISLILRTIYKTLHDLILYPHIVIYHHTPLNMNCMFWPHNIILNSPNAQISFKVIFTSEFFVSENEETKSPSHCKHIAMLQKMELNASKHLSFKSQDKNSRSQNKRRIWRQNCKLPEALVAEGDRGHGCAPTIRSWGVIIHKGVGDANLIKQRRKVEWKKGNIKNGEKLSKHIWFI